MVIIEGAYTAKMNTQQLASTLVTWLQTGQVGYFQLTYVSSDGRTEHTALIRPINGEQIGDLANGSEYIPCLTANGSKIGLLVPRPEARRSFDVIVLTSPRS